MLQLYRFFAKRLFKLAVRTFTATTASFRSDGLGGSYGAAPFAVYRLSPVVDLPSRDDASGIPGPFAGSRDGRTDRGERRSPAMRKRRSPPCHWSNVSTRRLCDDHRSQPVTHHLGRWRYRPAFLLSRSRGIPYCCSN